MIDNWALMDSIVDIPFELRAEFIARFPESLYQPLLAFVYKVDTALCADIRVRRAHLTKSLKDIEDSCSIIRKVKVYELDLTTPDEQLNLIKNSIDQIFRALEDNNGTGNIQITLCVNDAIQVLSMKGVNEGKLDELKEILKDELGKREATKLTPYTQQLVDNIAMDRTQCADIYYSCTKIQQHKRELKETGAYAWRVL